jgi:hypothetical protein
MWTSKTKSLQQPEKLKNVLVLHGHNASADYLAAQHLNNAVAPNCDSSDCLTGKDDMSIMEGFRSPDGIQYHHFKHKMIANYPSDDCNIAPCIDALEKYISKRGEKLDAIVVTAPYGTNYESANTIRWLASMKERFPDVKVLVDGYSPYTVTVPENLKGKTPEGYMAEVCANHFAIPNKKSAEINTAIKKVVITRDTKDYTLAAPIDMMPVNTSYVKNADLLRTLLNMPPYKEAGAGTNRNR